MRLTLTAVTLLTFAVGCSGGPQQAASQTTSSGPDRLVARRIMERPPQTRAYSIAPDGQRMAVEHKGGLAWMSLSDGAVRPVWSEAGTYVISTGVSPSGTSIAFALAREVPDSRELWVVDSAGQQARRVHDLVGENTWINVGGFSPDGRRLALALRGTDWSWQLAVLDTRTGATRVLKSLGWRYPGRPSFSPDGQHIAYDYPTDESTARRDLVLIAADGGSERVLTSRADDERLVGWSADGSDLLYTRDQGGTRALWEIPVVNGRAGEPRLRRADVWGLLPIGVAGDRLFYRVEHASSQIHVATVPAAAADDVPTRQLLEAPGLINAAISGDGAHIAYSVSGDRDDGVGPAPLHVFSTATGESRLVEVPVDYFWSLKWNGRGSLLTFAQKRGRNERYSVDLGTRAVRPLPTPEKVHDIWLIRSHGDRFEYFARRPATPGSPWPIYQRDATNGTERMLFGGRSLTDLSLSPDERYLAAVAEEGDRSGIVLVAAESDEVRTVYRATPGEALRLGGWSSDGSAVFVLLTREGSGPALWRMPVDGSAPTRLSVAVPPGTWKVEIREDGERVFFGSIQRRPGEIWVLEGLGTAATPSGG